MSVLSYLKFFDPSADIDTPAPEVVIAVELAQQRIDQSVFGTLYEQALARIVAHLLELRRRSIANIASGIAGVGPIASVGTGDLSISFGGGNSASTDPSYDAAWYSLTDHGREFLALRAQIVFAPRLV